MSSPRRQFPAAPTESRAVVIIAHPRRDSFNQALAEAWIAGAVATGATVETIALRDLDFDPQLRVAYTADQPLEPDLVRVRDAIAAAAHLVLVTPVWWGSVPAVLKGMIDRVLLPGWAFKANPGGLPDRGLTGRSGRLLMTMDAPTWWDRWAYRASARRHLANATLRFCGVKPVRVSTFGNVGHASDAKRASMLAAARAAGGKDGAALVRRFGPRAAALDAG